MNDPKEFTPQEVEQMGDIIDLFADHPEIKEIMLKKHPNKAEEIEQSIKERADIQKYLDKL